MDTRMEALEQLRKARILINERVEAAIQLQVVENAIKRLEQESSDGVPYQTWYPTDHAKKVESQIAQELQATKNKKRKKYNSGIVASFVCPIATGMVLALIGLIRCFLDGDVQLGSSLLYILGMTMAGVSYPLFARPAINARRRIENEPIPWTQEQIARRNYAAQLDYANTQQNLKKKAELDAELLTKNNARIAELQPKLEQLQKTYESCSAEVEKINVLGPEERNLNVVDQLIRIVESNRADSITAALLVYDEQQARQNALRAQEEAVATTRAMARQMAEAEEQRREEQSRRDREEAEHRRRMEQLANNQISEINKQTEELQRLRRENQDYQRSSEHEAAAYRRRMEDLEKAKMEELERMRQADRDYRKYGRVE